MYAGALYHKEIDFAAIRQSEKLYIQVSDNMKDFKTFVWRESCPGSFGAGQQVVNLKTKSQRHLSESLSECFVVVFSVFCQILVGIVSAGFRHNPGRCQIGAVI